MKVACYCGMYYQSDDSVAYCPQCGCAATLPTFRPPSPEVVEAQMRDELERLLKNPEAT